MLAAIPVYNESASLRTVIDRVREYCADVMVVDDGSTDSGPQILSEMTELRVVRHERNRGYGAAVRSAFSEFLDRSAADVLVTLDCDGQHQPHRIPDLLNRIGGADIVSGSRYLRSFGEDTPAPPDRQEINRLMTEELNRRFGLGLTDAFCGFKAYRRSAVTTLDLTEDGWGMPLELWVQAAHANMRIVEVPVPRIYLSADRAFGGILNDPNERIVYYRAVIDRADQRTREGSP